MASCCHRNLALEKFLANTEDLNHPDVIKLHTEHKQVQQTDVPRSLRSKNRKHDTLVKQHLAELRGNSGNLGPYLLNKAQTPLIRPPGYDEHEHERGKSCQLEAPPPAERPADHPHPLSVLVASSRSRRSRRGGSHRSPADNEHGHERGKSRQIPQPPPAPVECAADHPLSMVASSRSRRSRRGNSHRPPSYDEQEHERGKMHQIEAPTRAECAADRPHPLSVATSSSSRKSRRSRSSKGKDHTLSPGARSKGKHSRRNRAAKSAAGKIKEEKPKNELAQLTVETTLETDVRDISSGVPTQNEDGRAAAPTTVAETERKSPSKGFLTKLTRRMTLLVVSKGSSKSKAPRDSIRTSNEVEDVVKTQTSEPKPKKSPKKKMIKNPFISSTWMKGFGQHRSVARMLEEVEVHSPEKTPIQRTSTEDVKVTVDDAMSDALRALQSFGGRMMVSVPTNVKIGTNKRVSPRSRKANRHRSRNRASKKSSAAPASEPMDMGDLREMLGEADPSSNRSRTRGLKKRNSSRSNKSTTSRSSRLEKHADIVTSPRSLESACSSSGQSRSSRRERSLSSADNGIAAAAAAPSSPGGVASARRRRQAARHRRRNTVRVPKQRRDS